MPKAVTKTVEALAEAGKSEALVKFAPQTQTLIEQIETDVESVPTGNLVIFYAVADTVVKRLTDLSKSIVRLALISRRDEGAITGSESKHRYFREGDCELTVEARRNWKFNPEKATKILKSKKLYEESLKLSLKSGGRDLMRFLKQHKAELNKMGLEIEESIDEDALDQMVTENLLTPQDVEGMYDKNDDTYAITKARVVGAPPKRISKAKG